MNWANLTSVMVITSCAGVAGSVRRMDQDAETNSALSDVTKSCMEKDRDLSIIFCVA